MAKTKKTPITPPIEEPATEPVVTTPATPPTTGKPLVVKSTKKKAIPLWVWIAVGVVVLGGAATIGWIITGKHPASGVATNTTANTNTAVQMVPRVLDGILVPPDQANPVIIGAMIENLKDSRPPSGLDKASVVYEALAEGGITRFLAIFPQGQDIKEIGPIRSSRPYYISWAEEYHAFYLHAGGSPQALSYLKSGKANVIDFNQFVHGKSFRRDTTRVAPHNLYTSSALLDHAIGDLKIAAPNYTSWTFKDETPLDQRPTTVNDLVVNFSSASYQVKYVYDRVNNNYVRWVGGKPHVTRDGTQITANNVVVEYMKTGLIPGEKERLELQTVGTGKAQFFRDGTETEGTWKKDSNTGRTQFLDANGQPIALNAGVTWVEALPIGYKVTF